MVTALVLIEQSPAGEAWGVRLANIPKTTVQAASDTRYSAGCSGGILTEVFAYIEWFFARSRVSEDAPRATVKWEDSESLTMTQHAGISFSCDAVCKMLYAAQKLQSQEMELSLKLEQLGLQLQQASLELQKLASDIRKRGPTVTCLMRLFASDSATSTFKIAPYTDRLSDLSPDAQDWILKQLDTRTVWVRATEPNSYDNSISWTPFSGAVELSGKTVAFSYGNYRFW